MQSADTAQTPPSQPVHTHYSFIPALVYPLQKGNTTLLCPPALSLWASVQTPADTCTVHLTSRGTITGGQHPFHGCQTPQKLQSKSISRGHMVYTPFQVHQFYGKPHLMTVQGAQLGLEDGTPLDGASSVAVQADQLGGGPEQAPHAGRQAVCDQGGFLHVVPDAVLQEATVRVEGHPVAQPSLSRVACASTRDSIRSLHCGGCQTGWQGSACRQGDSRDRAVRGDKRKSGLEGRSRGVSPPEGLAALAQMSDAGMTCTPALQPLTTCAESMLTRTPAQPPSWSRPAQAYHYKISEVWHHGVCMSVVNTPYKLMM